MLKQKSAIVTGSTSGIGLGIARGLAEKGADVLLNGFGNADEIEFTRVAVWCGRRHSARALRRLASIGTSPTRRRRVHSHVDPDCPERAEPAEVLSRRSRVARRHASRRARGQAVNRPRRCIATSAGDSTSTQVRKSMVRNSRSIAGGPQMQAPSAR